MKKLIAITMVIGLVACAGADVLISQYVETDSGTHPKGIELWNSGDSSIDFSVDELSVEKGTNGGNPSEAFARSSGTLAANAVMVIGSDGSGDPLYDYMTANYPSVDYHKDGSFNHNGDDSFRVLVGGIVHDVFGNPGRDPGSDWSGNGVSTAGQNIQLEEGADLITTGDTDGWTDPSTRFTTVSTSPSSGGAELDGFGVAVIPEPTTFALFGLLGVAALLRRRLFNK